jgi:hypothetical protein
MSEKQRFSPLHATFVCGATWSKKVVSDQSNVVDFATKEENQYL